MQPAKQQWFSDVFEAGLVHQFYNPVDVVAVATPPVLAEHLPREVMASVLAAAMEAKLTPDQVVSTVSPRIMSEHVPDTVLWKCIAGAADRTGITNGGAAKDCEPQVRSFLRAALESGLSNGVLRPEDVVRHLEARVLVDSLPHELTARLLAVGLEGGSINAALVIEVIGVAALAEHAPTPLLWQCVQEIQSGTRTPPPGREAAKPKPEAKAEAKPEAKAQPEARPKPAPEPQSVPALADFQDEATDVRGPTVLSVEPDAEPDAGDAVIEIIEERAAAEPEDKRSAKRGIFGRRKR